MKKTLYCTFLMMTAVFILCGNSNVAAAQVAGSKICNQDPQGLGDPKVWYCTPTNPPPEGCTNQTSGDMTCYMDVPPAGYTDSKKPVPTTADQVYKQYIQNQPAPTQTATQSKTNTLSYSPLEPLPGLENVQDLNFAAFLGLIFKILITVGALLAVGTLVYAGISYMLSEAFETKGEAKNRMKAALWGLIILLGAWLMLYTINPQLLNFNLSSIGTLGGSTNTPTSNAPGSTASSAADLQRQIVACPGKPEIQDNGTIKCK